MFFLLLIAIGVVAVLMSQMAASNDQPGIGLTSYPSVENHSPKALTAIYAGSLLGRDAAGFIRPLAAGDNFYGVSEERIASTTVPTDGAGSVRTRRGHIEILATISGVVQTDVAARRVVYASDDNTFTLSPNSGTAGEQPYVPVGVVVGVEGTNKARVMLQTHDLAPASLLRARRRQVAAAVTLTVNDLDSVIECNTQSAAFTVTLPAVASCTGRRLTFERTGTGTNAVTLDGAGSETVDGSATFAALDAIRDIVTIISDGAAWKVESARIA